MPRHDACGQRCGTSFAAKRWYSLYAGGWAGMIMSVTVHLYALVVIPKFLVSESVTALTLYVLLYVPTALLALTALLQASITNPGAVPLGARPLTTVRSTSTPTTTRTLRRCPKCHDNYKPARAHHDSVTGRCIVKFDHYCPWVNNAVGALNHKFFVLFLFYTAACCVQVLVLLFLRLVHCGYVIHENDNNEDEHSSLSITRYLYDDCNQFEGNPVIIVLTCISFIFLLFTTAMGCEQIQAIQTGHNKIARMKMRVGQRGDTELQRVNTEFNEVMGGSASFQWHWLSPFHHVSFPRGMRPVVLGYEWDPTFPEEAYYPPNGNDDDDNSDEHQPRSTTHQQITTAVSESTGTAASSAEKEDQQQHDNHHDVEMQILPSTAATSPLSTATTTLDTSTRNRRRMMHSSRQESLEIV